MVQLGISYNKLNVNLITLLSIISFNMIKRQKEVCFVWCYLGGIVIISDFCINNDMFFNCRDIVITSILQWQKLNWQIVFLNSWGFSINREAQGCLGDRIGCGFLNTEFPMKEYLGVEFFEKTVSAMDVLNIIRTETECKRPVVLNIDAYWCHWTRQYKKEHNTHSIIVTGIDEEDNIYCSDFLISHIYKKPIPMEFGDFKNGYKSYLTWSFQNRTVKFDWKEALTGALLCSIYKIDICYFYKKRENIKNPFIFKIWLKYIKLSRGFRAQTMFGDLEFFASSLEKLKEFKNEIANEIAIFDSPIFYKIRDFANGRKKFAITLKFIGEQFGIDKLFEFSERINAIGWAWEDVKCQLLESFENCNFSLIQKCCEKILCISGVERTLAFEMLKFCSKV